MPVSKRGAVPSKQWSCSELKDGEQKLTAVKREPEDDLESKIKEYEKELAKMKSAALQASSQGDAAAGVHASPEDETQPATADEIEASKRPKRKPPVKAAAAKSVTAPPVKPSSPKPSPGQPSPNPAPTKRLKGKQPNSDDPLKIIQQLQEANKKMEEEMMKLRAQTSKPTKSKGSAYMTPPPKVAAPSPGKNPSSGSGKTSVNPPPERPAPATEGAKLNRLRRLCERKPSGRCNVPAEVHEKWLKSNKQEKEAMIDELESVNWSKDLFVSRITKTISQKKTLQRKQKRGWFTKEQMQHSLGWSLSYIKCAIEYCEKPGNERLWKKDRYNKKLRKYYVVYGEEDDDISENEEMHQQHETGEAKEAVQFQRVGEEAGFMEPDSDEDSEQEKKAEAVNTAAKEYQKFATFTSSLLSRSSKLSDLIGQLESELGDKAADSTDGKRVAKCVHNLESAIELLNKEFATCEILKVDAAPLRDEKKPVAESDSYLAFTLQNKMAKQIRESTVTLATVTTAEVGAKNILRALKKANES